MLVYLFIFILGTILGSFLNVIILRLNTGVSALSGRSRCSSCGRTLRALELLPILSFVFLRGRCHSCRLPISFQYPLIELLVGILAVAVVYKLGAFKGIQEALTSVLVLATFFLFLGIAVYDYFHKVVPNVLLWSLLAVSLALVLWRAFGGGWPTWEEIQSLRLPLDAGMFLFMPFFLVWYFSSGRLMGLGDALLALSVGLTLGLSLGGSAIILGVWLGALFGVVGILKKHLLFNLFRGALPGLTMKSEVPLAPFLFAGFLLVWFWDLNLFNVYGLF